MMKMRIETSNINSSSIKPNMLVICADGRKLAVVDHMEGYNLIKLKNEEGEPHYIPFVWVTDIEGNAIKIDRYKYEAMMEWSSTPMHN